MQQMINKHKSGTPQKACALAVCAVCIGPLATNADAQIAKPKRDYVHWDVTPASPNWQYATGQEALLGVNITHAGMPAEDVMVYYTVGNEMQDDGVHHDSVEVHGGLAVINAGTLAEPGFRTCVVTFRNGTETHSETLKLGFDVDQIAAVTAQPRDFDHFWKKTIAEARKTPLAPERTEMADKSTDEVAAYKVKLHTCKDSSGKDYCVYGYLSIPRDGKQHPVLLCPPGAGVKMDAYTDYYAKRGYVFMSMEIHGLDPDAPADVREATQKELKEYMGMGIADKETYYYRNVYTACVRAMDYLCSLEEYDGLNAGVTGGSQGGALTLVTAALHEHVTFLAAFYPALADLTGFIHSRAGGWPRFFSRRYVGKVSPTPKEAEGTLPYYDVVNFARRIKVPGFYNYGFEDEVCSATSVSAAINAVKAEKQVMITPTSGHWRFAEAQEAAMKFMRGQWK